MARMPQVFRIAVAMNFLLSSHATASAQATGTISGTVEDETGAVLPGVSVSVSVAGAPAVAETVTDMTGVYRFESLDDGAVTVRDRDTMAQDRISMDKVALYISERLA